MFESSVSEECDAAVYHQGYHQNGTVLGNRSAIFLATFLAKLVHRYKKILKDKGKDFTSSMNKKIYKQALIETLMSLAVEDMKEHGRLLAYKEKLVSLVDP